MDLFLLTFRKGSDGVTIGNGNDLCGPREATDRGGGKKKEESKVGTTHAGVSLDKM